MKKRLFSASWVLPIEGNPIKDGALVISGNKILDVGKQQSLLKKYPKIPKWHYPSAVLLPGFVNTHCHTVYTLLKGRIGSRHYAQWLARMVQWVRSQKQNKNQLIASSRKGIKELLLSGVTTVADSGPTEVPLQALKESGIRGIFYKEIFGFAEKSPERLLSRSLKQAAKFKKKLPDRLQYGFSPHSPYTMPPELLSQLCKASFRKKIPITIHVAESTEETTFFKHGDGAFSKLFPGREKLIPRARSSVQYLESRFVLGPHLLASHCVQVDNRDIQLLSKRKVPVSHCPTSNAQLCVGKAPTHKFLKEKVIVGLGTDGGSSVPSLDFFSCMRDAAKIGKLTPKQILEMATIGGAKALNWHKQIGSLKRGKKADLIVVDLGKKRDLTQKEVYRTLVFRSRPKDLSLSIVDGQILVQKKK